MGLLEEKMTDCERTRSLLGLITNMSSTYNNRMMKSSSSSNFLSYNDLN
jgi:hypothetical protein